MTHPSAEVSDDIRRAAVNRRTFTIGATAALLPVLAAASLAAQPVGSDTLGFRPLLAFSVTDSVPVHEVRLPDGLVLRVRRQLHANGTPMGWYVAVHLLPASDTSRNLLYHSLAWHGPYPTDFLAWLHAEQYYPDDRVLPVHGYPLELRLVCRHCATAGDSTFRHFTTGTFEAAVRTPKAGAAPRDASSSRRTGSQRDCPSGCGLRRGRSGAVRPGAL
jgi:hypothetical protein